MADALILIVEDEKASRDILERLLRYYEIAFHSAKSAEEALNLIAENHYVLAVVDLSLPGLDGWALQNKLKEQHSTMQMIALTAYYAPDVAKHAREAGFTDCFPKPANRKLMEYLRGLLAQN